MYDYNQGNLSFVKSADIPVTVENVYAALSVPENIEIVIVSFSSRASSKNIQLVFKKEDGSYLTFEDIIKLDIKPENFKITMGDTVNNPKADSNGQGTYHPEGSTGVEHKFTDSPLFVCRNNEYGGNFASTYPKAGFMKVHCEKEFEKDKIYTVAIENVFGAAFKTATKDKPTFTDKN